jgi:release factor glutamine methyltransferase
MQAGRQRFLGLGLLVAEGELVPRPETETLGRVAVEALTRLVVACRAIDPGVP